MGTIYKASVNIGNSSNRVRIYFKFSAPEMIGRCVSISETYYGEWDAYHITTNTEVHHTCPEGTWILYLYAERNPEWMFRQKDGHTHEPTISLANEPKMEGRHYDITIEDELINKCGCVTGEKDFKDAMEWYRRTQGVDFSNPLQPKIKWKGGNEMKKSLYHVILFNRKTEKIDFKEYIPAQASEDAKCRLLSPLASTTLIHT